MNPSTGNPHVQRAAVPARPQGDPLRSPGLPARASEGAASPSLDRGTQLGFGGTLYPSAGEGVVFGRQGDVVSSVAFAEQIEAARARSGGGMGTDNPTGTTTVPRGLPHEPTPDRARENAERASRRARGRVRRYVVSNGIARLVTLTRADQSHDRSVMVRDLAAFERGLRGRYPTLAYVWVIESHKSGALHAHLGLSQYVDHRVIRRLWPHGFIDVRKIRTRQGGRESARAAARYLGKYVSKSPARDKSEHRYEVRQGFQPAAVRVYAGDLASARLELLRLMGGELPSYEWSSASARDWRGPPAGYVAWANPA
jgi:hypothetical protein